MIATLIENTARFIFGEKLTKKHILHMFLGLWFYAESPAVEHINYGCSC